MSTVDPPLHINSILSLSFYPIFVDDWPRLLLAEMKPVWLRIDFDKWKIESSEDDNDLENQIDVSILAQFYF